MKILYIITKSNWGGAQRYVYDLAAYFNTETEYEVAVALGGNGGLKQKLEEKNIRVIPLAALGRDIKIMGDIRAFFEILKLLHKEQPDIIHLNSTKAGLIGSLACFFYNLVASGYRLSAIFTAHGWAFNESRPAHQKIAIAFLQWLTVLLCDHIIVVAEHLKKQTRWWPFVARKISVVHNGIPELEFLSREKAAVRFPYIQHTTYNIHVITIAELHKNKGLDVAIRALSLLKDCDFSYTIIGDGEERAALETLIKKLGLEDRVFLAGHIPDAHKYLKAFDLFLLPSRTEACAYVLLEAGRAGLPVIATRVGGIPEVIEHKKTGLLVPPDNPHALTHAIRYAMEHPVACAFAGREFENEIKKNFEIVRMFENTKKIYTMLICFSKSHL